MTQTRTSVSGSGRIGIIDTSGTGAFSLLSNNRWVRNAYWLPSTQPNNFVWSGQDVTDRGWIASGQDVDGTFNR